MVLWGWLWGGPARRAGQSTLSLGNLSPAPALPILSPMGSPPEARSPRSGRVTSPGALGGQGEGEGVEEGAACCWNNPRQGCWGLCRPLPARSGPWMEAQERGEATSAAASCCSRGSPRDAGARSALGEQPLAPAWARHKGLASQQGSGSQTAPGGPRGPGRAWLQPSR